MGVVLRDRYLGDETGQGPFDGVFVGVPARNRNLEHGLPHRGGAAGADRDEQIAQAGLLQRIQAPGAAKVDQPECAAVEQQDVARVRVGMEEPVDEHLVHDHAQQFVCQLLALDVGFPFGS